VGVNEICATFDFLSQDLHPNYTLYTINHTPYTINHKPIKTIRQRRVHPIFRLKPDRPNFRLAPD
jgi:hypothetical protein